MGEDRVSKMNINTGFKTICSFLVGLELKLESALSCVLIDASLEKIMTIFSKTTIF